MLAKSSCPFRHHTHNNSGHHGKLISNRILVFRICEERHCAVWFPPPNLLAQGLVVEVRGHVCKELLDSVIIARRVAAQSARPEREVFDLKLSRLFVGKVLLESGLGAVRVAASSG
jgi:hypothetical protein